MVNFAPLYPYRPNNTDLVRCCYPHPNAKQQERLTCLVLNQLQKHYEPTHIEPAEFSANMEGELERYDSILTNEYSQDAMDRVGLHNPPVAVVKIQIGMIKKLILNNTSYCYVIECVAWCCDEDNDPIWLSNEYVEGPRVIGTIISMDWRTVPGCHDPAVVEACKQTSAEEAWRLLRFASVKDYDEFGVQREPKDVELWLERLGRAREMPISALVSSRSGPLLTGHLEL